MHYPFVLSALHNMPQPRNARWFQSLSQDLTPLIKVSLSLCSRPGCTCELRELQSVAHVSTWSTISEVFDLQVYNFNWGRYTWDYGSSFLLFIFINEAND